MPSDPYQHWLDSLCQGWPKRSIPPTHEERSMSGCGCTRTQLPKEDDNPDDYDLIA